MTRNGQFCPICNFSNLFPAKWLRMNQNGWFCLICNFSNLFTLKLLRMTLNGQFCLISNFCDQSMSFLEKYQNFSFLGGGGHSSNFVIFSNFLSHFTPKRLKMAHDGKFCLKGCLLRWENIGKLRIRWNWPFQIDSFWATSVGKEWKSWKSGEIGHSRSFWGTLVGKDLKSCKLGKIGHSGSF